jgi:hypothetical protein
MPKVTEVYGKNFNGSLDAQHASDLDPNSNTTKRGENMDSPMNTTM